MKEKVLVLAALTNLVFAGKYDDAVRAFQNAPDYVAPIATVLGSFGSSGWNHNSSIPKTFSGSFSLPLTVVALAEKDRSYSGVYLDTNLYESSLTESEIAAIIAQPFTTPTVFGRTAAPTLKSTNLDGYGKPAGYSPVYFSDGIEDVASFNWLPLPAVQTEFSAFHTAIKLRYLGKPGRTLGIHFPGVGIQHDCASFLPPLPVNLSLFGTAVFPILNWTPGENISGTLEMRGFSTFSGLTVGKDMAKAGMIDLFLEAGWEYSQLTTGGELRISDKDSVEIVKPDMNLTGRNRFRAGLVIAFNPGKRYRVSGGAAIGAEGSFMLNPLGIRYGKKTTNE